QEALDGPEFIYLSVDIDVDRQIDELGAVECFLDGLPDHGLHAAVEQLAHQVPAHALRPHPLEGLPSSQGAPTIATSGATRSSSSGSVSARTFMKVAGPRCAYPSGAASGL